jgi:hypothetical protein
VLEGAIRILAVADTIRRIKTKKRTKAVKVPKTEARKFLKKFIEYLLIIQI